LRQEFSDAELQEGPLLAGEMATLRPAKKVDSDGSPNQRVVSSLRSKEKSPLSTGINPETPTSLAQSSSQGTTDPTVSSEQVNVTQAVVDEIIIPQLQRATRDDMDAKEIEALSMLARGFRDLKDANPELTHNVILDILAGINE